MMFLFSVAGSALSKVILMGSATDRGKARSVTQLLHYWRYYGNASVKRLADMHHYEQLPRSAAKESYRPIYRLHGLLLYWPF